MTWAENASAWQVELPKVGHSCPIIGDNKSSPLAIDCSASRKMEKLSSFAWLIILKNLAARRWETIAVQLQRWQMEIYTVNFPAFDGDQSPACCEGMTLQFLWGSAG